MAVAKIGKGALLLVADGAKALILSNDDTAEEPSMHVVWKSEQPSRPDHETGTERPGRVHESASVGRSSVEMPDEQDRKEAAFLEAATEEFTGRARGKPRVPLLIAAPPSGLAVIRKALPKDVRARVCLQVASDLTHMPLPAILAHFKAAS